MQGVWPAVVTPFDDDRTVNWQRFRDHCEWMVESGCAGVVVNGSLGEYETLTGDERARAVSEAIATLGPQRVVPGVSGRGAEECREWTVRAAEAGVPAVMALPPTVHVPTPDEVVAHYRRIGEVGMPIIAYNNPFSTNVDLTPDLLGRIRTEVPEVCGVKEFSGDVRRVLHILDEADGLQVIAGCDDALVEAVLVGARGWIAGFVNVFPEQSVRLYDLALAGDVSAALELYREMLPVLRFDADPRFVQAIKLGLDLVGRYGGPCRSPRMALPPGVRDEVDAAVRRALAAGA